MTDSKYRREPQAKWEQRVQTVRAISDERLRAIAQIQYAIGEGAGFLAAADIPAGIPMGVAPEDHDKAWGDFFEHAEAGVALKGVHGLANAVFMSLSLEEKLMALEAIGPSEPTEDRDEIAAEPLALQADQQTEDESGINSPA